MWQTLKPLSNALACTGLSIVLSLSLLVYGYQQKQRLQTQLYSQQQQLAVYQQQYQTALQQQRSIKHNWPIYQSMLQSGYIGEERREEWLQALAQAQHSQQLFVAEFLLSPASPYQIAELPEAKHISRSIMQLTLPMLHEEDLLQLLQSMRQNASPPFVLRQCLISRLASDENSNDENSLAPHLQAKCELDRLSMQMPQSLDDKTQP